MDSRIQVFPNPVNFRTAVRSVQKFAPLLSGFILRIFDTGGHLLKQMNEETRLGKSAYFDAEKTLYWDGTNVSMEPVGQGIYFWQCSLADGTVQTGKILVLNQEGP